MEPITIESIRISSDYEVISGSFMLLYFLSFYLCSPVALSNKVQISTILATLAAIAYSLAGSQLILSWATIYIIDEPVRVAVLVLILAVLEKMQ